MEFSPAESMMSYQSDNLLPLFETATPSSTTTMNPLDAVTPASTHEASASSPQLSAIPEEKAAEDKEKKPAKKRKSWGQVLPEPKTNLPPRKRAKTEDEKEQRRVERVLRNRRAAQSSRERKRQEVEALEIRNKELEKTVERQQELLKMLSKELQHLSPGSAAASLIAELNNPCLSLSQPLFTSSDTSTNQDNDSASSSELIPDVEPTTVNPAALSPSSSVNEDWEAPIAEAMTSSAETQRPAAMLCDLQCPPEELSALVSLVEQKVDLQFFPTPESAVHDDFGVVDIFSNPQPHGDFDLFDFNELVHHDDLSHDTFDTFKANYDNAVDQNDFARLFFSTDRSALQV